MLVTHLRSHTYVCECPCECPHKSVKGMPNGLGRHLRERLVPTVPKAEGVNRHLPDSCVGSNPTPFTMGLQGTVTHECISQVRITTRVRLPLAPPKTYVETRIDTGSKMCYDSTEGERNEFCIL